MKTRDKIEDRIRFLLVEELNRRVAEASRRLPHLCTYNHRQPLDTRRHANGEPNENFNRITTVRHLPVDQTMGLCMFGAADLENWNGTICEDPIDAQRCPVFTPMLSKQALFEQYRLDVNDMDWVRENMPEMYGLLWVLDTGVITTWLPWWKRLWFRVLRIRVEGVTSNHDVLKLMPDRTEGD